MTELRLILKEFESMSDIDWFHAFCNFFREGCYLDTKSFMLNLGKIIPFESRFHGSQFIEPFDKISINPILSLSDDNQKIFSLRFYGKKFSLPVVEIMKAFKEFMIQYNTYDGGTQLFFHPIPKEYNFTAIDVWTPEESIKNSDVRKLKVDNIVFLFASKLQLFRDGYSMVE